MASEWITFVKMYAKNHKIPYNQALKEAAPQYRAYIAQKNKLQKRGNGKISDFISEKLMKFFSRLISGQDSHNMYGDY
jgi:hypothetical protein